MSTAKSGKSEIKTEPFPLISIIIPVYNGSNFLKEAIDSSINQKYQNIEVIVVNDGSNDDGKTEQIAKSYANKIRYFSKTNGGVSSALNFGIKKSRGQWISWLSHDDIYPVDRLSGLLKVLEKNPDAKFIYGKALLVDENKKPLPNGLYDWKQDNKVPLVRQFLKSNKISGWTTLVHKEIFEKVGLFNEANKTAQDYEMWALISAYYKMYRANVVAVYSRWHKDMGTQVLSDRVKKDVLLALKNIDNKLPIQKIYPEIININDNKVVASYHNMLGDFYLSKWELTEIAQKHYLISKNIWPSFLNQAYYRFVFGIPVYKIYRKIRFRCNYVFWKLTKIINKHG